jgi:predicted ATPase
MTNTPNSIVLRENNWDDFGFKATFRVSVVDGESLSHDIGDVKVGYAGQGEGWTSSELKGVLGGVGGLPEKFFSLGQGPEYYSKIRDIFGRLARGFLSLLNDVVVDDESFHRHRDQRVLKDSLMRYVSLSTMEGQYRRIIGGGAILTEFNFSYMRDESPDCSSVDLDFHVRPDSRPPTNIHVLIGRNGVGKTTLLNGMISAVVKSDGAAPSNSAGRFLVRSNSNAKQEIYASYFSSVVSISFSAFDPFVPPVAVSDRSKGPAYVYIGLKKPDGDTLKAIAELRDELAESIEVCFRQEARRARWVSAIEMLESDPNFEEMGLRMLADIEPSIIKLEARKLIKRMSSGHAIVLLSISRLIEAVEEKTLVIIDEPESHLHPPLLAAFARALSELLMERNGVAIIATHSPVVLQEVPRSCVWKLWRTRAVTTAERPENETFGENVGILTREVFGLEVSKSGFHALLERAVGKDKTFDDVVFGFKGQIGLEGRAILRALVMSRARGGVEE